MYVAPKLFKQATTEFIYERYQNFRYTNTTQFHEDTQFNNQYFSKQFLVSKFSDTKNACKECTRDKKNYAPYSINQAVVHTQCTPSTKNYLLKHIITLVTFHLKLFCVNYNTTNQIINAILAKQY